MCTLFEKNQMKMRNGVHNVSVVFVCAMVLKEKEQKREKKYILCAPDSSRPSEKQ